MVTSLMDLLSTAAGVVVVGLAAIGLLVVDLVRRELGGSRPVGVHHLNYGAALTVAFVALVTVRFLTLGA